jgi:transcriptional regulator with XRE-family HTH domain
MKHCRRDFPGLDRDTSDRLAADVVTDENAILHEIGELRRLSSVSLEAIGYLIGSDPAQLSRYLRGTCGMTLTNYLRIARALGYRARIVLEQVDSGGVENNPAAALKITAHKVRHHRGK